MATVVNNTPTATPATNGSNGTGFLLGIILLILFVGALLYYGLPALNRASSGPNINVPEQIDVNVNNGQ